MKLLGISGLAVLATMSGCATAQFAFDAENTDEAAIFNDIKALWTNWAAIGNQVLARARDSYPDAYTQLTHVYGTTSLPDEFDEAAARNAAEVLAQSAQLTVWDKDAGDHAAYSFAVKDVEVGVGPTTSVSEDSESSSESELSEESESESSESDSSSDLSDLSEESGSSDSSSETLDESDSDGELDDSSSSSGAVVRPAMLLAALAGVMHLAF
ncbi:hypothetical protein GGH12_002554 [Coemansia sp. RSA 1822]|nr:hypothetical protein LPJ76_000710 [Coemansia sp. RSA 638]KAJ2122858.1 hypothetical protein IW147_003024 [Coemansia sp. RSA 720]KAJ2563471.1 hypothetical protein GGH12_002554 [Coemansia sp. RSA 1822]